MLSEGFGWNVIIKITGYTEAQYKLAKAKF
jgi:hypothetical protein